jgi:hypothetical protein
VAQLAMLLPLLVTIAVIQVLPQVDLPDTAFHEDTAPIVTKSRALSAATLGVGIQRAGLHYVQNVQTAIEFVRKVPAMAAHPVNQVLPILLSTLLC